MADVRRKAEAAKLAAREGRDLLRELPTAQPAETFRESFADFWEHKKPTLKNKKHKQQWENTMRDYVFPVIGDRPVANIGSPEIIKILKSIWRRKVETAIRVRQRMSSVFEAAIVREARVRANPCVGVEKVLGVHKRTVTRRKSLPWHDAPRFVRDLRAGPARPLTRLCFEFLILTAARSEEARGAEWSEMDLEEKLWTIPAERTKTSLEDHVVPLSERCVQILQVAKKRSPNGDLVFPAPGGGMLSDNTLSKYCRDQREPCCPHGFRATFKTWCEDHDIPDAVSEAALSHKDHHQVRAAYVRTNYLDQRRKLMDRWSLYICDNEC